MSTKIYWGYKQASDKTGIPVGTLYALVSTKRIPHVRLGKRHVLFNSDEVMNWIEEHQVKLGGQQ